MNDELNIMLAMICVALLIIMYIVYSNMEGFEDMGVKYNVDKLYELKSTIADGDYEHFKQEYSSGDAVLYTDLLRLYNKNDFKKEKIKNIYIKWK